MGLTKKLAAFLFSMVVFSNNSYAHPIKENGSIAQGSKISCEHGSMDYNDKYYQGHFCDLTGNKEADVLKGYTSVSSTTFFDKKGIEQKRIYLEEHPSLIGLDFDKNGVIEGSKDEFWTTDEETKQELQF